MLRNAMALSGQPSELRRNALGSVLGVPWAISPAGLSRVLTDVERLLSQSQPEAVSAGEEDGVEGSWLLRKRDGIATLRLYGPLVSPSSWLSWYYPNYERLAQELTKARDDVSVQQIVLILDSPGGHVNGCHEFVSVVRAVDAVKPVTAFVEGDACSAAYWVAASCRRIVTAETSVLGCLGAQVAYMDDSKALENWGLREMLVTSSQTPLKNRAPTDAEGHAVWQQMVDDIADVFLNDVAALRGRTREHVDAHFGQGAVLVGTRAVSVGLADTVGMYESLHAELVRGTSTSTAAGAAQLSEVTMARRTGRRQASRRTTAAAHEPNSEVRVLVTRDVGVAEGDIGEVLEIRDGSFYRIQLGDSEYAWLAEDELEAATSTSSDEEASDSPDDATDDAEASSDEDEEEETQASRRAKPSAFRSALASARKAERQRITGILALAKAAPMAALLKMIEDPKCTPEGAALQLVTGKVAGVNAQALAQLAGDDQSLGNIGSIDGGDTPPNTASAIVATLQQHNPRALKASARTTRG